MRTLKVFIFRAKSFHVRAVRPVRSILLAVHVAICPGRYVNPFTSVGTEE